MRSYRGQRHLGLKRRAVVPSWSPCHRRSSLSTSRGAPDDEISALALKACDSEKGLGCDVAARVLGASDPARRAVLDEKSCDYGEGDGCYAYARYVLNNSRSDPRLISYYRENSAAYDAAMKAQMMADIGQYTGDVAAMRDKMMAFAAQYDGPPPNYHVHHDALMARGCELKSTAACSYLIAAGKRGLFAVTGTFDNDIDLLAPY